MIKQADDALVAAARGGDQRALEDLVGQYLPLVYSIVGRALTGRAEVDDVVQDTMIRLVRGLGGLRDPLRFRSWLVAVTMNQIRRHSQTRRTAWPTPWDPAEEPADPKADFVEFTVSRLDLSAQRREVVRAGAWLDPDDRRLLSLWWLETAGEVSRADVIESLELSAHHVTVRIARMKVRLEDARGIVRALTATPRCPGLSEVADGWDGRATPLWRKRFARHIRNCRECPAVAADLVPARHLLPALLPLPVGYLVHVLSQVQAGTSRTAARQPSASQHRPVHRAAVNGTGRLAGKAALGLAAATAATVGAVCILISVTSQAGHVGASAPAGSPRLEPAQLPTGSPASQPLVAVLPSASATTAPSRTAPSSSPSTTASGPVSPALQVLALMNQARAQIGLPNLIIGTTLNASARTHDQTMVHANCFSHQCPGESAFWSRESAAGVKASATGECIAKGGPVADTDAGIAKMAVGMTRGMLNEKPPNDGHRQIILGKASGHVGIDVYRDSSGVVWMTLDFSS